MMLLQLPNEMLVHALAPFLDCDTYCVLRSTCRALRELLPVRDRQYYGRRHDLRLSECHGQDRGTGEPFVVREFVDKHGRVTRPDGPAHIRTSFYNADLNVLRTTRPYVAGLNGSYMLTGDDEYMLSRQWIGYKMGGSALYRDGVLCVCAPARQRLLVYQEYRNARNRLHRTDGPAWFYARPVRKRGARGQLRYQQLARMWAEEYWHNGQPRAMPQPWRILYFASGSVRERWYYAPDAQQHIVHNYNEKKELTGVRREDGRCARIYRRERL